MVLNHINAVNFLFSDKSFIIISIFIFLTGLSIGSFLNVVIFRLPAKSSIVYPPSSCPECGAKIKFYDNIPVLSYVILRGRCRNCGVHISPVYPAVEILTALLFYLLFLKYFYNVYFFYKINASDALYFKNYLDGQFDHFLAGLIFIPIMISISFIDLFNKIIPDVLNVLLIILGFAVNIFLIRKPFIFPLAGFLTAGLFFYFIALFYEIIKKKEGLGGGDIKLIAGIGAFLGLRGVIFTIFGGAVFALAGFILFFLFRKLIKMNPVGLDFKIPFGPFLSLASVLYLFYGDFLIKTYTNFIIYRAF